MVVQGAADAGGLVGELGELSAEGGVMLGFAGVEPGDLLADLGKMFHEDGCHRVTGARVWGAHRWSHGYQVRVLLLLPLAWPFRLPLRCPVPFTAAARGGPGRWPGPAVEQ